MQNYLETLKRYQSYMLKYFFSERNNSNVREDFLNLRGLSRDHRGAIMIEGYSCDQIASEFLTPTHIVSKSKLLESSEKYVNAFKGAYKNTEILYAYKAGSVPGILDVIHGTGIGAEVISGYELWLALKLGVSPDVIIFNGPLKASDDLSLAIQKEIFAINIDSFDDMKRVEDIARNIGKPANIGIRLSLKGGYSIFGISPESDDFFLLMDEITQSPWLNYRGLMTHLGGRSEDSGVYVRGVESMARVANKIQHRYRLETSFFDVGGGIGVSTVRGFSLIENALYRKFNVPPRPPQNERYWPIEKIAEDTVLKMKNACKKYAVPLPKLICEPGRAIVASSQLLLLKVYAVKKNWGQWIAITDGGRFNVNYPVEHEYHDIFLANRMGDNQKISYFLSGRISTAGDFVHRSKEFPMLKVGDVIALMDSGAYFTQFSSNFSFPRPGIVLLEEGKCTQIRNRETYEHLIAMDSFKEFE